MKKKIKYEDAPYGVKEALESASFVKDFLPPPELLVTKEETKKITLALSQKSIDYFKTIAEVNHIPYQQIIRKVLDAYTDRYGK